MTPDAQRLANIRAAHAAIHPAKWSRAADGEGEFIETALPGGELVPICRIDAGASMAERRFLVDAPAHVSFLLSLVDRAIAKERQRLKDEQRKAGKDYAAEAAMKCGEPAFKAFLEQKHGLERPLTDERVTQRVRSLCGVKSRRELNEGGDCAERWRSLVREFEGWKRAGR